MSKTDNTELIEHLREQVKYHLSMARKYKSEVILLQMQSKPEHVKQVQLNRQSQEVNYIIGILEHAKEPLATAQIVEALNRGLKREYDSTVFAARFGKALKDSQRIKVHYNEKYNGRRTFKYEIKDGKD